MTIQMDAIASASSASWYHSGTPKLSCKQCLCIYKAPCLARACWTQSKPVVLHRADAGFAFFKTLFQHSAGARSHHGSVMFTGGWDCIPTSRTRTAKLQCRACSGLCTHKGTACRCWSNQQMRTGFFVKRYRKDNEIGVLSQNALPANAAESIL